MEAEGASWEPFWKTLSEQIMPKRGFFRGDQANRAKSIDFKKMVDGSPMRAVRTLASGLQAGLTSPARPWFRLGSPDPDLSEFHPVRRWLDGVQQMILSVCAKADIYSTLYAVYEELAAFGTGAAIILPDPKTLVRGRPFSIGEYYLGAGQDLRVNALARRIQMTALQMIESFGKDAVSRSVRTAYDNSNSDQWFDVLHLIEPNDDRIRNLVDAQNKAFRSVYWQPEEKEGFLRVSGFDNFPIVAPRWDVLHPQVYGKGPGWEAIGDCKMLQQLRIDGLKALKKVIDPPLNASPMVQKVGATTVPGGVNYMDNPGQNGIRPLYQISPDFQALEMTIQQVIRSINETFYKDLFLMIATADQPNMTAREVIERHEEKLLMLGPILERIQGELLNPLIDTIFNMLWEAGAIPPPPQELLKNGDGNLKVEFVSVLAQAQKMVGLTSIDQFFGFVARLAAVNPEVLLKVNLFEAVDHYADALGISPAIVEADDVVEAKQQQIAKAQEQQAMTQQAMVAAEGARTLSQTEVTGNNALNALLGGMGGGGQ